MKLDSKIETLPLSKSNPKALMNLFGRSDITPMWIADMDFEVAIQIQDALIKRISNSGFSYEYKPNSFLAAQQEWYKKQYGLDLNQDHIVYNPSITTTIAIAIENFTSENDGIIIQPPVFMEFRDVIRKVNRRIVKNPLKLIGNQYKIDFEDLEAKAKLTENKILILCNPHNPVGRVWKKKELDTIVRICKKHNIIIISDEIHKDIILFDNTFTSLLNYSKDWKNIIVCTSEAKTFNLAGISDSMAIIPDETLRNTFNKISQKYNLGATNVLTRVALETAYLKGEAWLNDLIKTIESNIVSIEKELVDSKIKLIKPEGTYQVWLDFRDIFKDSKAMFQHITKNSNVGLNAGHWFGREGALFMRMNIATSNKKVINAIKKIKAAANLAWQNTM
jgi:putative C-S lyase